MINVLVILSVQTFPENLKGLSKCMTLLVVDKVYVKLDNLGCLISSLLLYVEAKNKRYRSLRLKAEIRGV